MTEQPVVSVVMPARNAERFVVAAVRSVLDQTFGDIECIVVDDGSSDATAHLVAGVGDDRVRCVRTDGNGATAARNLGVSLARGGLVAFLDADDVWLPSKLEQQVALFRRRPELGLVFCGYEITDEELHPLGRVDPQQRDTLLHRQLLLEGNGIAFSSTAMVRKSLLDELGGFDQDMSVSADLDLALRLVAAAPSGWVPAPLVLYRIHEGQMHRDLVSYERDMRKLFDRHLARPGRRAAHRRALANLHVRLFLHGILTREVRWRHLGAAALARPDRIAVLPLEIVSRRAVRRLRRVRAR